MASAELVFLAIGLGVPAAFWLKNAVSGIRLPTVQRVEQTETQGKTIPIEAGDKPATNWIAYVNQQPDRVPHLAVIGPSGAGKTTLTTAVLAERDGQIIVLTAKEGDYWGGLEYIGIDEDATYTTANRTFSALLLFVKQRLVAVKRGMKEGKRPVFDTLTIVVDDYSTLQKECKDAAEMVKLVARLGRSLRVRLVMLSDSALVKALGLEGEGETRANFAFIRVQRGHSATIEIDDKQQAIDTSRLERMAQAAQLAPRMWAIPMPDIDEDVPVLGLDLADSGGGTNQYTRRYNPDTDAAELDYLIGALVDRGLSANKIYDIVGGGRSDVLARVRKIRGEV